MTFLLIKILLLDNVKQKEAMSKRIAIAGLGGWSSYMHLPVCEELQINDEADYIAVCDLRTGAAEVIGKKFNAAAYTDFSLMLKEQNPDGVLILVNPQAASALIQKAIEFKVPFLVEKPPAESFAKHQSLVSAVGDLPHVVAYNRRFSPFVSQAVKWVDISEVKSIEGYFLREKRYDEDFSSTLVHPLDLLMYLSGGQLKEAFIEKSKCGRVFNYFLSAVTENDCHIHLTVLPDAGIDSENYILQTADKKVRIVHPSRKDEFGSATLYTGNRQTEYVSGKEFGLSLDKPELNNGVYAENVHFIDVLNKKESLISTLQNTLVTQKIRELFNSLPNGGNLTFSTKDQ